MCEKPLKAFIFGSLGISGITVLVLVVVVRGEGSCQNIGLKKARNVLYKVCDRTQCLYRIQQQSFGALAAATTR